MSKISEKLYDFNEASARLKRDLPHWYLENEWIRRKYRTGGWRSTLMVANTVAHLAEAAWHHPELSLSYACVIVSLRTHSAGGLTDKDFELASKIEQVIQWQPGLEDGALDGIPDKAGYCYLKYDSIEGSSAE